MLSERNQELRNKSEIVAKQRESMNEAFADHKAAEGELLDAILAIAPALDAVCTPIKTGKSQSIWRGLLLGQRSVAKSNSSAVVTQSLYVDPDHRLLRVTVALDLDTTVTPITAAMAVEEFAVEESIGRLAHALEQQLRGKGLERAKQAKLRAEAIRGIVALVRTSKLTGTP